MLKLWMEWDYGQDLLVFASRDDAVIWMNRTIEFEDFDDSIQSVDDIFNEGFAGFSKLEPWKP